jgi:hypothetical protein
MRLKRGLFRYCRWPFHSYFEGTRGLWGDRIAVFNKITKSVPVKLPTADWTAKGDFLIITSDDRPISPSWPLVNINFLPNDKWIGSENRYGFVVHEKKTN